MKLTYRDAFNNPQYNKYSKLYLDFRNKKLENNSSVIYLINNEFKLGFIVFKDYEIEENITLVNFPFIQAIKELIPSTGKNCILI